jgi:predicted nuclease with TOPRIM domain
MTITLDEILKLFTAGGALLVIFLSVYQATQSASKNGFDQLVKVVDELKLQVKDVKAENVILMRRIENLEREKSELREWAELLVDQVKEHGGDPVPMPKHTRAR